MKVWWVDIYYESDSFRTVLGSSEVVQVSPYYYVLENGQYRVKSDCFKSKAEAIADATIRMLDRLAHQTRLTHEAVLGL